MGHVDTPYLFTDRSVQHIAQVCTIKPHIFAHPKGHKVTSFCKKLILLNKIFWHDACIYTSKLEQHVQAR